MSNLIAEIISQLDRSGFCGSTRILETSYFSSEQFAFKVQTKIFSSYYFRIRIYCNKRHYDYLFQVFDKESLCRWDNKEHFLNLKTFPHHYHTLQGDVIESPLQGDPSTDLNIVLTEIKQMLGNRK